MLNTPQKHWHVTGPPGTGKTRYCARQARKAAAKFGPERVVIASLTRAAAREFSTRPGIQLIPTENVGTLHAMCLRALDRPPLAEVPEGRSEWNDYAKRQIGERWMLSGDAPGSEREGPREQAPERMTDGDRELAAFSILRATLTPQDRRVWRPHAQLFVEAWEAWKAETERLDFTDLIEQCIEQGTPAPGKPAVLIGDECQDWSKLELKLFREVWGEHAEKVVLVGDPDQAIYAWRGADPRVFLDFPVPEDQKILLERSYRVPSKVLNCSLRLLSEGIRDRAPVIYLPRLLEGNTEAEGKVERLGTGSAYKNPYLLIPILEQAQRAGETVMVLGSCEYMLGPICSKMKQAGLPFHNPWRPQNGRWNPIRRGSNQGKRKVVTKLDRLLAFLAPSQALWGEKAQEWSWQQIALWTRHLRSNRSNKHTSEDVTSFEPVLSHGAKSLLRLKLGTQLGSDFGGGAKTPLYTPGAWSERELSELFVGGFLGKPCRGACTLDLDWFVSAMLPGEQAGYRTLVKIVQAFGVQTLLQMPLITVGTIHSVKGAEASTVILFPDLSMAGAREYQSAATRPAVIRLFYVAMTRAQENLYLCSKSSPMCITFPM